MCRSSNLNYHRQTAIDASSIGLRSSAVVHNLTSSLATALQPLKSSSTADPATRSNRKSKHAHIIVEHHYHDHANEDEALDERPARGGVTTPFPIRLHKMLDKMEADGYGDVISWQPHGRCFVVRKPKEFKELLPTYFKLSKMASFQRQLNLYGFQRLTRGRDKNGYYHEYFLRGKPALSNKITRTKVKGTGVRARSNPGTEPHLWEMTWVGTDHDHSDEYQDHSSEDEEPAPSKRKPSPVAVAPIKEPVAVTPCSAPTLAAAATSSSLLTSAPMPPLMGSSTSASAWSIPFYTTSSTAFHQYQPTRDEHDIIMSFGGKSFHYLDPSEMSTQHKQQLQKKRVQVDPPAPLSQPLAPPNGDGMQDFVSNLELDKLYSELDEENMDNDDAFMNMLERVLD